MATYPYAPLPNTLILSYASDRSLMNEAIFESSKLRVVVEKSIPLYSVLSRPAETLSLLVTDSLMV
jgi:hypothetical protein